MIVAPISPFEIVPQRALYDCLLAAEAATRATISAVSQILAAT